LPCGGLKSVLGQMGPSGRPDLPIFLQPLRELSMIRWGVEVHFARSIRHQ
jgi:hypothetical protein